MRFCIVYPYLRWLLGKPCGGAEKQVGLLAQHLVRRGHDVTFVALEYRGHETEIGGVHIRRGREEGGGGGWLRAATRGLPSLERTIAEIGADLYYVRGAQAASRWVISAAHALGAPALVGLASDRNLRPQCGRALVPLGRGPLGGVTGYAAWLLLQRPALRAADAIIVQNEEQASRCSRMGLPHLLVPSIVEPPPRDLLESEADYDVVWAANVHTVGRRGKGVEPLLALVRTLPEVRFAVVGALTDVSLGAVLADLREAPNVDLLGSLGYGQAQALLARSRLVLNTSRAEGFSNVMLEGWALGRPSVTLSVNPSGLLAERRWPSSDPQGRAGREALGACAGGDLRVLSRLVGEALGDEAALRSVGRRCRAYVAQVHDADVVCARYEDLAAAPRCTPRGDLPIQEGDTGSPG